MKPHFKIKKKVDTKSKEFKEAVDKMEHSRQWISEACKVDTSKLHEVFGA